MQRVCAATLVAATLALSFASVRVFRRGATGNTDAAHALWIALWAALLAFAALPFFGYLFGKFVTHTMEVRYVIAALIAFAVALALALKDRLRSDRFFHGLLAAILCLSTLAGIVQIRAEQRSSRAATCRSSRSAAPCTAICSA